MDFKPNDPIYMQIAEYVNEQILLGKWAITDKISSVRELATNLQVNPNTVMRAYEYLQQNAIIYNKRGIGFFVGEGAIETIKTLQKERFLQRELPDFFRHIYLLNISLNEISERYKNYISNSNSDEEQH